MWDIVIILYQLLILKHFPFMNKRRFIDFIAKNTNVQYTHIYLIVAIQVVFRTCMIMAVEQLYKFRCLDRFKANPNKAWFFIEEPSKYTNLRYETYKQYFTSIVPLTLLACLFLKFGKKSRVDYNFPTVKEMLIQINGSLMITDFTFYFVHRFVFHSKMFYYLHKDHHQYYNPTVHASMKMSFVDYLFEVLLPGAIGPRIFDMHLFTQILYLITGNMIGIMSHSGYVFPFKPLSMQFPLNELCGKSNNRHHEIHHNEFNNNYSALSILPDMLFGTTSSK